MATLLQSTVNSNRFGRDAGNNINTVAFGFYLNANRNQSVMLGWSAGWNTSGAKQTSIGPRAVADNTGNYNTGVGHEVLRYTGNGSCNTIVGVRAGRRIYGTGLNTLIGQDAACGNNSNWSNNVIGYQAGKAFNSANSVIMGAQAMFNGGGTESVAIGFRALCTSTGARNIAIGSYAGHTFNQSNGIAIGRASNPSNTSGHISWGTSLNNQCNCIYGGWTYASDARDKTNAQTLPDNLGLNFLRKLRPVSYVWDNREHYVEQCGFEYGQKDGTLADTREHYGLIAQEVKQALEELNARFDGLKYDEEKDTYRITYTSFVAPLTKALQEIDERVQALKVQLGL